GLSALRQFFSYWVREGECPGNPAKELQGPRTRRKLPVVLSQNVMERMMDLPNGNDKRAQRDRAILELLYSSGLRVSELCGLRMDELHMQLGVVRPMGKGSKERLVPMGQEAVGALQLYLKEARPQFLKGKQSNFVFIGNKSKP